MTNIREKVSDAVRRTVNKFRQTPCVFFTETDLQAYLYHCLYSKKLEAKTRDGVLTTCVHKEYPTNFRYSKKTMEDHGFEKRGARGHYDLAVLNPRFIRESDITSVINKDVRNMTDRMNRNPQAFRKELIAAIELKHVVNNSRAFIDSVEKDAVKLSHGQRYQDFEAYNLVFCNLKYYYLEELTRKIKTVRTENPVKNLLAASYFEGSKKVTPEPITNGWRISINRSIIYVGDSRDVLKRIKTNHCRGNVEASALRRHVAEAMGYKLRHEKRPSGSTRTRIDLPDHKQGERRVSNYIRTGKWRVITCPPYETANDFQWYAIEKLNPLLNRKRKPYQQSRTATYQQLLIELIESSLLDCRSIDPEIKSGPGVYALYHKSTPA